MSETSALCLAVSAPFLSAERTDESSISSSNGFSRKSTAPTFMASTASETSPCHDHRNVDAAVPYTAQEIDPRDNPERTPRRRSKTVNVLVSLVPMALGLGLLGLFAFLWALRSGQYSDVDGAAQRVLSDDDLKE